MKLSSWILAAAISFSGPTPLETPTPIPDRQPVPVSPESSLIEVRCSLPGALQRALTVAEKAPHVEIVLDGVCVGNFTVASGSIFFRGLTPDSGIAAPDGNPSGDPLLHVVDANVVLSRMVILGGVVGVLASGADAEVFAGNAEVRDQEAIGLYAEDGARLRLFETIVENSGGTGVFVRGNGTSNIQRSTIGGHRAGIDVSERSFLAISDTTVENNDEFGLYVSQRSDANVLGGSFTENGQGHLGSGDWSRITLLNDPAIGSATDSTPIALSTIRYATVVSYGTADIFGDASALIGGSLQLGNTVLHGDLTLIQFADAFVRNAEITGSVACLDGADAICRGTTTAGSFGCASTTCGAPTAEAVDHGEHATRPAYHERQDRPMPSRPR